MSRTGLPRRLAALLAIALLLFAQGLVAAYACVLILPAAAAAPCEEGDAAARDALCKAHCEAGTQSVDPVKPLPAPVLGTPLAVLRAGDLEPRGARSTARRTTWLAHAGAPPPFLLYQRLRN
jgi:hypothetical protein